MPKRFNEFAKGEIPLDGAKLRIDAVVNKEILVLGFKLGNSKYNKESASKCLTVQFEMDDQRYILFTGSAILIEQITKYRDEIPFYATIKKIDRYYSFA